MRKTSILLRGDNCMGINNNEITPPSFVSSLSALQRGRKPSFGD